MYAVTKEIRFCYGHRLLRYAGKCRHLHGHNGKATIELSGKRLDARGMLRDFDDIKREIQGWVDTELDHKMLLNKKDPILPILRKLGEPVVSFRENPTAEFIAKTIFEHARSKRFPVTRVDLWETPTSFASYSGK